jgi:hypothetical protein
MHTIGLTKHLLTFILLGIIGGTMVTAPHRGNRAAHGDIRFPETIRDVTAAQGLGQEPYVGAWMRMKSNSEAQIRANDTMIRSLVEKEAKARGAFRTIYQKRRAELERRNISLKGMLNDFKGERGEPWVERK